MSESPASLCELANSIAQGEVSAMDALDQMVRRAQEAHAQTNCVATWRIDEARRDAEAADSALKRGERLGPLHGVPISIKECFDLAGTPSTMGLPNRAKLLEKQDGEVVRRLRQAGAVIFAKTNVPQLMISHDTANPLFGVTTNPWDATRTPGGSSGGEAALIASGGSLVGLGSDLGGSIRVPCHFCGISGLKPTSGRLPRHGGIGSMRGLDAVQFQPGPMARRVADCGRLMEVLCDPALTAPSLQSPPLPLGPWREIDLRGRRVGYFLTDSVFATTPAVRRAVEMACKWLHDRGVEIIEFEPRENDHAFNLLVRALSADGGADHQQHLKNDPREPSVNRLVNLMRMPLPLRRLLSLALSLWGDASLSRLVVSGGAISTAKYWDLTLEIRRLAQEVMERFRELRLDSLVFPVYGLPAVKLGDATDALPAASCSFFSNILGAPCGAVPVTTVRAEEQQPRPSGRDSALKAAARAEAGSQGLPIGVQVLADYWREDMVLAVMQAIEEGAIASGEFPQLAR